LISSIIFNDIIFILINFFKKRLIIDDLRRRMEYLDRMFPSKDTPSTIPGFTMTPQLMLSPAP